MRSASKRWMRETAIDDENMEGSESDNEVSISPGIGTANEQDSEMGSESENELGSKPDWEAGRELDNEMSSERENEVLSFALINVDIIFLRCMGIS